MTDTFTPAERSQVMAAVKSRDTSPEMAVRRIVHRMGYRYRLHVAELPGAPDLVFPRLRKIVIVNGCFWHMHTCGQCRIPATRRSYWVAKLARNQRRDARQRGQRGSAAARQRGSAAARAVAATWLARARRLGMPDDDRQPRTIDAATPQISYRGGDPGILIFEWTNLVQTSFAPGKNLRRRVGAEGGGGTGVTARGGSASEGDVNKMCSSSFQVHSRGGRIRNAEFGMQNTDAGGSLKIWWRESAGGRSSG